MSEIHETQAVDAEITERTAQKAHNRLGVSPEGTPKWPAGDQLGGGQSQETRQAGTEQDKGDRSLILTDAHGNEFPININGSPTPDKVMDALNLKATRMTGLALRIQELQQQGIRPDFNIVCENLGLTIKEEKNPDDQEKADEDTGEVEEGGGLLAGLKAGAEAASTSNSLSEALSKYPGTRSSASTAKETGNPLGVTGVLKNRVVDAAMTVGLPRVDKTTTPGRIRTGAAPSTRPLNTPVST